nr:hypothetical protein [Neobacillus sp. Marseille-Q6967]
MDWNNQMAAELEKMMAAGEVDQDVMDEVTSIVDGLKQGQQDLNDFYRASTPHKLLEILDEVNQRVKR